MTPRYRDRILGTGLGMLLVVSVGAVAAQQVPPQTPAADAKVVATKKAIRPEDYGVWETLGMATLSPDGRWLAYGISRADGDPELRVRMLATEATDAIVNGAAPRFSKDAKWLAYAVSPSEAEREKASAKTKEPEKTKEAPKSKVGVKNLVSGEVSTVDDVAGFSFSDDGKFLLLQRYPMRGRESSGVDLIVRNLMTGIDTSFGNVAGHKFNEKGTLLALIIDAEGKVGNGVQIFDPEKNSLRTLDSSPSKYTALTWRKDAPDLAVLRENEHAKDEDASFVALAWQGIGLPEERKKATYDFAKDEAFPKDQRVVDFGGLSWSDDGQTLFFGVKAWENKPAPKSKKDETKKDEAKKSESKTAAKKSMRETLKEQAGVEVWHPKDVDIIPLQKKGIAEKKREHYLAAWWVGDGKLVQLGDDLTEEIVLVDGQKHAIGLDNTPHEGEKKFGPTLHDVYLVDVKTGERKKLLDRLKYTLGSSPDGRYLLYVRDKNLWTYDTTSGAHVNLTGALGMSFVNQELSVLTDEKPPYGTGGWTKDGSHLLLYDRFDIWDISCDGKTSRKLTDGRKDQVVHRRLRVDFEGDGDRFVQLDKPMVLSLTGELSKQSGLARMVPGEKVETLTMKPKAIARLVKAANADVLAYVEQDFDDSPDLFITGPDMTTPRQVSLTNPFQKDFLWGRSELVDYKNANGEALQGALIYPADYEPGKTYPMIVYIYEKLSQQLHAYVSPSERSPYNPTVFSAEGYFVFMPDIVYRAQNPGLSAVECVVPAVKKVLESGKIDPKRVGLVGHSWGAYQTAFLVTQTDIFAAGAAGAPLTNMMSMSVSIYWNSGQTNAWIFHESQGRMDRPFWQDVDTYIKNSPVFQIDKLNTPLLVTFGDEDGAVDWNQGVEMYNAARLANKPLVMLVYPGENHGLAKKPNQVDYHYRILDWFGYHLKGQPAPKWITQGQTHLDRQKELEAIEKKKAAEAK